MRFSTPKYDIQLVMGSEVKDKELPRVLAESDERKNQDWKTCVVD